MQQRLAQLHRLRRRALKCRPLRYSQPPRRKRAKALFRRQPRRLLRSSGDDSKAAHLRQPLLSRHCLVRDVFLFPTQVRLSPAQALGGAALPSESSPEERSNAGVC